VFADARRALGALDPYRRELVLSLGCALENLMTAARGLGYDAELALLPDPEDATHAARITLAAAAPAPDAAFAHIGGRHTNRGPYDPARPVLLDTFHGLVTDNVTRLLLFDADSPEGRRIGEGTVQATAEIIADHEMAAASYAWMRHEWDHIQRYRDGPSTLDFGLSPGLRTLALMMPAPSQRRFDDLWLASTRDTHVATARGFGVVAVSDRFDPRQGLSAGRLWQRLHLHAAAHGLAMQPLNQMAERADRERQLGRPEAMAEALATITGDPAWQATFLFRYGYPQRPGRPSARRPLDAVVRPA
jgi:hypothetical protein